MAVLSFGMGRVSLESKRGKWIVHGRATTGMGRHGNGAEAGFNIPDPAPVSWYPPPNPTGIEILPPGLPPKGTGFPTPPSPAKTLVFYKIFKNYIFFNSNKNQ